jgi:asparaginyl-tRNA synthetase
VMFGGSPVFVKWFPSDIKSFYMPVVEQDPGTSGISHADCFDLLFPIIGEVVGGSMRETSYEKLRAVMQKRGMDEEPLKQYLDIRKDGSLPHGGAGIGFARLLMTLTGILQIKDMVEMPRSYDCFA